MATTASEPVRLRALLDDVHAVRYAPQLGDYSERLRELRRARVSGAEVGVKLPRGLWVAVAVGCCSWRLRCSCRVAAGAIPRSRRSRPRAGDYPRAIAIYDSLAASGFESAALYWNWAQAASARGSVGEALWADAARARAGSFGSCGESRHRAAARGSDLDRAELAPDPLATFARRREDSGSIGSPWCCWWYRWEFTRG